MSVVDKYCKLHDWLPRHAACHRCNALLQWVRLR